jgi:L-lactate dehydrogenase complex protein LldG
VNAREEVLARVRAALDGSTPPPPVPRDYATTGTHPDGARHEIVGLFAARVDDYRAQVHRVAARDVPATIAGLVGDGRVVVPAGLAPPWVPRGIVDAGFTALELDEFDAVVTGCRVGIAVTGTIVLDGAADQGRRALTLVPDHHVCVVRAEQVVETVPQALHRLDPTRVLTFISGPSATSDIELQRVEGVHGPRRLDVLIVD